LARRGKRQLLRRDDMSGIRCKPEANPMRLTRIGSPAMGLVCEWDQR
jgi:hypothetical protein